jgi:hypothetical protein
MTSLPVLNLSPGPDPNPIYPDPGPNPIPPQEPSFSDG